MIKNITKAEKREWGLFLLFELGLKSAPGSPIYDYYCLHYKFSSMLNAFRI